MLSLSDFSFCEAMQSLGARTECTVSTAQIHRILEFWQKISETADFAWSRTSEARR
jgi:hypothetical protein